MIAAPIAEPAAPPVEPQAEESDLRIQPPPAQTPTIQPPSTGEQVAAERPNRYFTPPASASDGLPETDAASRNGASAAAPAAVETEKQSAGPAAMTLPFDDFLPAPQPEFAERETSKRESTEPAPAEQSAHHA
jgi:hypothetical protein